MTKRSVFQNCLNSELLVGTDRTVLAKAVKIVPRHAGRAMVRHRITVSFVQLESPESPG